MRNKAAEKAKYVHHHQMQTSPSENKSSSNNNNNNNTPVPSNPVFPSEQQQQQIDSCYNNNNNNLGTMKNQNLMDGNQANWAYSSSPLHVTQEYADEHLPVQLKGAVHSPQMAMKGGKQKRGSSSPVGYTINGILGLQQDFDEKRKRTDDTISTNPKRRRESPSRPMKLAKDVVEPVILGSENGAELSLRSAAPHDVVYQSYYPGLSHHDAHIHYSHHNAIENWPPEPQTEAERASAAAAAGGVLIVVSSNSAIPKEDYGYTTPSIYTSPADNVSWSFLIELWQD